MPKAQAVIVALQPHWHGTGMLEQLTLAVKEEV